MSATRTRTYTVEVRTSSDLGEGVAEAYVTTWDTEYAIGRSTYERIDRGAFELDQPRPLFYEHDWAAGPIGEQTYTADNHGLLSREQYYLEDPRARSIWRGVKAGTLNQRSIGFGVEDSGIRTETRSDGSTLEIITRGDLVESSVVVRGANPDTETVSKRAVPAMPQAAPVAPMPGMGMPGEAPHAGLEPEDEPVTKAGLFQEISELIQMAEELNMIDQLPKLVAAYIKMFQQAAGPAVPDPNAPPVVPVPAARSANSDLPSGLIRALARQQ